MTKTKLEWALYLASRGLKVAHLHHTHPDGTCSCGKPTCTSQGKHPVDTGWQNVAASDPEVIKQWFREDPEMNYGCVAGEKTFMLDIDVKDGDGYETAAKLLNVPRSELDTITFSVKTPSGGEHLYFESDKAYSNSVKKALGMGLDVRSGNGQVVGPGSTLHVPDEWEPDKFVQVSYEVVNDGDIAPLPETIRTRMNEALTRTDNAQESMSEGTIDSDGNVERARHFLKLRDPAIQGQGGDHHTYITACKVRELNISAEKCLELMTEDNGWNERCEPPWDYEELSQKIENAFNYAKRQQGAMAAGLIDTMDGEGDIMGDSELPVDFDVKEDKETMEARNIADARKKFHFYDGSAVLTVPKHYDFIADAWLPAQNYTIVLGGRGSGKTTIILDMICHAASDVAWHTTEMDPGWYFIYIAGEDFPGVKERYEAWCMKHQDLCKLNTETQKWELKDPSRVQFIDMAVSLTDKDQMNSFGWAVRGLVNDLKAIKGQNIKVCFVVDTWQRMTSAAVGGQSSDEAMQAALDNLEGVLKFFEGPCIIAAHPPKANNNTMAGSGIIENRSDAIWQITALGGGVREIKVTRIKGAEEANWKNVGFINVKISGIDKFQRQRKSVSVEYQRGSIVNEGGKVSTSVIDWQRTQDMLLLLKDMLTGMHKYNPFIPDSSQTALANIVMELFESKEEIKARCVREAKEREDRRKREGRTAATDVVDTGERDEQLKEEWAAKLKALGFKDNELRRPPAKLKIGPSKHPFFKAVADIRVQTSGAGEIASSGNGIIWSPFKGKENYLLRYDKMPVSKADQLMEAADKDEELPPHDPETGELTELNDGPEDFADGADI